MWKIPVILLWAGPLVAQLSQWTGATFEHEVTPVYGYALRAEYRAPYEFYGQGTALLTAALNRKLTQQLALVPGVRWTPAQRGEFGELRFFVDLDVEFPWSLGPVSFEGRLRYQQDRPVGEDGSLRQVAIRPRLATVIELSERLNVALEYEYRYRFDALNRGERDRYTGGLVYTFSERTAVELYYRYEDRLLPGEGNRRIVGLYLDYVMPDKRERDWKYRRPFGRRLNW